SNEEPVPKEDHIYQSISEEDHNSDEEEVVPTFIGEPIVYREAIYIGNPLFDRGPVLIEEPIFVERPIGIVDELIDHLKNIVDDLTVKKTEGVEETPNPKEA